MPANSKTSIRFNTSLVKWGGWAKLALSAPRALLEKVSTTVGKIGRCQTEHPARVGTLAPEQWVPIATALPTFLNAYLQQELNRITDGPGDFITALRLVDGPMSGQMLMAIAIVARENFVNVEVVYTNPYGPNRNGTVCRLGPGYSPSTLTIHVGLEHGEEYLPIALYFSGETPVLDQDESTPKNPVWVGVPVDRKVVVFTDGFDQAPMTKQQWDRDEFLKGQGFQPIRFTAGDVERDPFGCAVKVVERLTGKNLDKSA
jgi:hypothetical protein